MDLGLAGKTAIVTAASRGIGKACAAALAGEGANVAICARGAAELRAAAAEIGPGAMAEPADVTEAGDVDRLVARTVARFGGVDVLVAIGGSPPYGPFDRTTDEDFARAFEMTVLATARLIRAVAPHMRSKGWGRIVAVQSRSVKEPIPGLAASNAARPGAAGLIKDLSAELAADGVLLNTVAPGRILTDRLRDGARASGMDEEAYYRDSAADLPIRRLGAAREVADVVAFLASERASYVNGVTVAVDGGLIRSAV